MGATSKPVGSGKGNFERPENGSYPARCIQVVDLGTHEKKWEGKTFPNEQLLIVFEISELMEDGRPFTVNWRGTNSLSEKANLYKFLTSWRNKSFTQEELEGFDYGRLLDATCLLSVVTEPSNNGKEYTDISAVMPLPKGMKAIDRVNPLVNFGIRDLGSEEYDKLWPWVQKIVDSSEEGQQFSKQGPAKTYEKQSTSGNMDPDDSEIPF